MNAFPSSTTLNQSAAWPPTPTPAARTKRAEAIASDAHAAEATSRKRLNSEEDLYPPPTSAAAQNAPEAASQWQPYDMSKHVAQPTAGPSSSAAPREEAPASGRGSGSDARSGKGYTRSEAALAAPRASDISLGSFSFSRRDPSTPAPAPAQWLPSTGADESPENVSLILRKSSNAHTLYRSAKMKKAAAAREDAAAVVLSERKEPDAVLSDPTRKSQPQWVPAGRVELMGRVKWNTAMWAALVVLPRAAAFQAVYWMLLDGAFFFYGSDKWLSALLYMARWLLILTSVYNVGDAVVRIRALPPTVDKPKRAPNAPRPGLHGPAGSDAAQPPASGSAAAQPGELSMSAWEEERDRKPFYASGGSLRNGLDAAHRSASRGIALGDESILGRSFSSSFNGDVSRSGVDRSSPLAPRASAPGGGLYGANRRIPTSNAVPAPNEPLRKPSTMSAYFARSSGTWTNAADEYAADSILADRAVRSLSHSLVNPRPDRPASRAAAGSEVLPVEEVQQITPVALVRSPAGPYVAPAPVPSWYGTSWIGGSNTTSKVSTPSQAASRLVVSFAAPKTPAPGGARSAEEAAGVDALL